MNVSTSASWTRPAVGIVRVEQAICTELAKLYDGEQFKLCIWDGADFVEWHAPPPRDAKPTWSGTPFDATFPVSQTFDPLERLLGREREKRTPSIKTNGAIASERVLHSLPPLKKPQFGDILISVGLDWDHSYTDSFYRLKAHQGVSVITCCYDLIPVLFPQYCVGEVAAKFKEYFTKLTWGSSAVLCISGQTERDYKRLCEELGAPVVPTRIIPLGDNLPSASGNVSDAIKDISKENFLLFVSTIERRKNHEVLYRAYHLLCRQGHRQKLPKLIFVGMQGWGVGDFMKDVELDPLTKDLIIQLNHVNDAELTHLYEKAAFCVYPSLYEGWGLPVGEALAMGKAVVASAQGSLPEVGGDLVRYADPWNAAVWAETLLDLIENPTKVAELEARVRSEYRVRTWAGTAKAVQAAIDETNYHSPFPIQLSPGYDMSTHCGVHVGPAIVSKGDPGLLLFGPHRALPSGAFRLHGTLRALDRGSGRLVFKVVSNLGMTSHATKTLAWDGEQLLSRNGGENSVDIEITLDEPIPDFELICHAFGEVHIALEIFNIDRLESATATARQAQLENSASESRLIAQGD